MKLKIKVIDIVILAMLGALMYVGDIAFEALPNIHLVGVFIVATTYVYRVKALFPIYIYVFLNGLISGFGIWWIPYLYIWAVLWGFTMLLPRQMSKKAAPFAFMAVCALHGFLFGTLYAPFQAIMFGLDFKGTLAWIVAGLPFDAIHGVSNFLCGALISPIISVLARTEKFAN